MIRNLTQYIPVLYIYFQYLKYLIMEIIIFIQKINLLQVPDSLGIVFRVQTQIPSIII